MNQTNATGLTMTDPPDLPDTSCGDGAPSTGSSEPAAALAYVELLFFAYRDFTGDPDAILARYGFGRAHHRVLHFVSRNPGLRVADLLEILKITKQSLARVLKQLIGKGYVLQEAGLNDRRERLLYVTAKGETLTAKLAELQTTRVRNALKAAGPGSEATLRRFLFAMIGEDERQTIERLVDRVGVVPTNAPEPAPGAEKEP